MKNIFLFLFAIGGLASCRSGEPHEKVKNAKADSMLVGYWIPKNIKWESPHSGSPDIDTVVRTAYIKVLRFDSSLQFTAFVTTMNYPKRYDSVIFEFEPGVDIYGGTWKEDSDKLIVNYRFLYSGYEKKTNEPVVVETMQPPGSGSLRFDSVQYVRTTRFDAASLKKMEAYRVEAGVE